MKFLHFIRVLFTNPSRRFVCKKTWLCFGYRVFEPKHRKPTKLAAIRKSLIFFYQVYKRLIHLSIFSFLNLLASLHAKIIGALYIVNCYQFTNGLSVMGVKK